MNNLLYNTLNCIHGGIVLLNEKLEIVFWNDYMEYLTAIKLDDVIGKNIYDILPNLDKRYFKYSIENILKNGYSMFFSAAIHKKIIETDRRLNLKISRINEEKDNSILFEFTDVTNQFLRIDQLKDYVKELYMLNEKLKEKEKTINTLAYYDFLTGVANRTLFYKVADKFYYNSKRNKSLLGMMFIDVDKFKDINDTYGHKKGDEVLILVSKILESSTRTGDLVARYGGDEFLVLLPNITQYDDIELIASRIIREKNKIFNLTENQIEISLSIGISVFPKDGNTVDELITRADEAMYVAKNTNGDKWILS